MLSVWLRSLRQWPLHHPDSLVKSFPVSLVWDAGSWVACWELIVLGCSTSSVELLGPRVCLSVFFFCKMGPRITQCSAFGGFLSSFPFRSSFRPSYLIFSLIPEITMRITGHRWMAFEMLKQLHVSKPDCIGGGKRGTLQGEKSESAYIEGSKWELWENGDMCTGSQEGTHGCIHMYVLA